MNTLLHPAGMMRAWDDRIVCAAALWRWGLPTLVVLADSDAARAEKVMPPMEAAVSQTLYLRAFVDGLDKGQIVRVDRQGAQLWIAADELTAIGIRVESLPLEADRRIALDALPGVRFVYGEAEQRLDLAVPDALRQVEWLGQRGGSPLPAQPGTGLVLNYAALLQGTRVDLAQRQAQHPPASHPAVGAYGGQPLVSTQDHAAQYDSRNRTFALTSELRFFSPMGVFTNRGYSTWASGQSQYIRQDSDWSYADPDSMRTYTVGDFVSSSLSWSRALRLGGVSIARNFQTRPDLVTFPVPALGGSAVVPTTVDLYINGLRQFTGQASGGPFEIATPPALTGMGIARLVYRDAWGRPISIERPLYVDARLLAPGLMDYALQFGYARRNYGSRSFDYAERPVFNASLRRGLSDAITLEANAQGAQDLRNAGVGGLFRLGTYGVLNAALTLSAGQGSGRQWNLGYQYSAPAFSVAVQGMRTQGPYRDLGSTEGIEVPSRQVYASLGIPIAERQNLMLGYSLQDSATQGNSRVVSLGYSASLGSRVSVFANLFKDFNQPNSTGVYVGLNIRLDDRVNVSASANRSGGQNTVSLGANRMIDSDHGGFGWSVSADGGNQDHRHALGRLDYRGRYGDLSAQLESSTSAQNHFTNASLSAAGAVVWMGGDWLASRTLHDAFGLVSTEGVAGIPVLRENRWVGVTNAQGHLLVPDLLPYQRNRLAIDTLGLPVDMVAEADRIEAAPQLRSGVLVRFPLQRYRGATIILVDAQQRPLPVGTPVRLLETQASAVVGYDGAVFFPTLQTHNTVEARLGHARCQAQVAFGDADAMKTLGPIVCASLPSP